MVANSAVLMGLAVEPLGGDAGAGLAPLAVASHRAQVFGEALLAQRAGERGHQVGERDAPRATSSGVGPAGDVADWQALGAQHGARFGRGVDRG